MTGPQWRLARQITAILERDIGRADADLARMLNVPVADVRQAAAILCRQGRAERCWAYLVLRPPEPDRGEKAA